MNTQEGNVVVVVAISTNHVDEEGTWVVGIRDLGLAADLLESWII